MDLNIINAFCLPEGEWEAAPYGNGHINDTLKVTVKTAEGEKRYVAQKVNRYVFKKPEEVMANMEKVTGYLRKLIVHEGGDPDRGTLTIIPAKDGKSYAYDADGELWRMLAFVDNTISKDLPDTPELMELSGAAFGKFQRQLADFPAAVLAETIPDFHNTPARFQQLIDAIEQDAAGRVKDVQDEIEFAMAYQANAGVLIEACAMGDIPLRVTHNDTKLNNVMLDADTRQPLCVIDLDTVMPGLSGNDFGDSIRFGASTGAEDEKDLDKIEMSLELFRAYAHGFLSACGSALTSAEIETLPLAAKLMTYECGIRFLTDYLEGDCYFRIHRSEHNLDRTRTQFKLVTDMNRKRDAMMKIIREEMPK